MHFFFHFFITPPTKSLRSSPQFSATPQLRRGGVAENCGVAETFSRRGNKKMKKKMHFYYCLCSKKMKKKICIF